MVSDIVLLEDLPDVIRKNAEAYGACIAGAEKKERYLALIEGAGFRNVKIIEEAIFPIEDVLSDPSVQKVIKTLKLTQQQLRKIEKSIVSIKVSATKSNP